MQIAVTFATVALSLALTTEASPVLVGTSDNAYCTQLLNSCAASSNALSNPWSVKACLFGAACFEGKHPVDGFLSAVASAKHASKAPASHDVPRVSQAVFNSISTNGKAITQQNYIDGVFGTLATTNGPFPDASLVIQDFTRLAEWTAFCTSQGIPFMNFADYYQFSATVNSPGCVGATTVSSSITTFFTHPDTTTPPATLTISATPASITTFFTHPDTTTPPATLTTSATPASITTTAPLEASCNKVFNTCVAQANQAVSDAWSHPACLFAATCFGGQRPVDGMLSAVSSAKKNSGTAPTSAKETRLSTTTMQSISTDGKTITQQNWIDGYYGLLSSLGGPFPTSSAVVIDDFARVRAWTGFCTGGIPFKNVADYFEFSSSVSSNTSC